MSIGGSYNYMVMKTKSIMITKKTYYFLLDNFTILNEHDIEQYNDRVFSVFKNYNSNTYNPSYINCSSVVISKVFDLDYVVSLDKFFEKFEEINLFRLN